jgi:biotin operon repressor
MKQTRNLDAHPPGADQEMSPDQGSPDEGCASRPSGWFAIDNSFFYGGWAAQAGPSAALVYSAIVMHANRETRRAWPSYNRLQSLTGLSRPTVGKCIKELARLGLIRVETRNGGRRQDAAFSRNGA